MVKKKGKINEVDFVSNNRLENVKSKLWLYVKNNVILLVILDWKERADFYFEKLKLLSKR